MFIDSALDALAKTFLRHGYEVFLVGGAVRDYVMGKTPHDFDIASNALPGQVMKIFHTVIPTGIAHGTVTVHLMGRAFEVTTFRTEGGYSDARHPDKVSLGGTIETDLSRRDFSMNALAINLKNGELIDLFDGVGDIKKGLIKAVGDAKTRFLEDGLRSMRAVRFMAQLDFSIEEKTFAALMCDEVKKRLSLVSKERVRDELLKTLCATNVKKALTIFKSLGVLDASDDDIALCQSFDKKEADLRLPALFFDDQAPKKKLTSLKLPNKTIERATAIITSQKLFDNFDNFDKKINDEELRKALAFVTPPLWQSAVTFWRVRHTSSKDECAAIDKVLLRGEREIAKGVPLSIGDLKIRGEDLLAQGLTGPQIGEALQTALKLVLTHPEKNTKATLLKELFEKDKTAATK